MDGGADSTRSSVADSTRAMEGSAAPNSSRGKRCGIGASAEERRRGLLASVGWAYREPHRVAKYDVLQSGVVDALPTSPFVIRPLFGLALSDVACALMPPR
ncbi:hypothetical protein ACQJBY_019563 [Aegilops geniculata]